MNVQNDLVGKAFRRKLQSKGEQSPPLLAPLRLLPYPASRRAETYRAGKEKAHSLSTSLLITQPTPPWHRRDPEDRVAVSRDCNSSTYTQESETEEETVLGCVVFQ